MKRISFLLLALLTLAAQSGQAQTTPLSLTGNVQTEAQQALSGAAVTVIHVPSGKRYSAASGSTGRFVVTNLPAGGPYLMQIGEGGYRSQTVESIFLENGKTANFSVTLSRLGSTEKGRAGRTTATASAPAERLAPESEVGGPVLFAANTAPSGQAPITSSRRYQPVPQIISSPASAPAAGPATATVAPALVAAAPAPPAATAVTPTAARSPYRTGGPRNQPRRITPPAQDFIVPGHYDAKSGNYLYDTGAPTTLKLPGGASIANVGVNSTENLLHRFLSDPSKQVDTLDLSRGWYNFDRVFFETGKATLTPESMSQLRNVVTLMRAYPTARVKIGGYTDSTGTYKVNKMLSEARARTAWASLVEMGISPARIDARGYGPRYGIAPNTTEVGRAMNRRLSVKVLVK
ncbi:OmpA family protein [Hymenobacter sp. DH14]|uniref:OmpA family protein n=1 Tax=Hymenobacter cyanobacteriorum TaxID=2926463 RepID=A0A9X1VG62_9BACT|nr:OmpA family protein [Hymenobacter cyanobacteriorum]MCI1188326.1 OmpA family protein [Hymenobacter cyanobacteriorum]